MARRFPPPPLHAGNVLSSRFRLVRRLANGSSATVWQATDELLGREVAIKALNPRLLHNRASQARLRLEAQALASLSHPHIATVHDFATTPNGPGDPMPYLVMELVNGVTLA